MGQVPIGLVLLDAHCGVEEAL
jgi:uncharacterized protein YbaR (Trm112 family)